MRHCKPYSRRHYLALYYVFLATFALAMSAKGIDRSNQYIHANMVSQPVPAATSTMSNRIAKRLRKRLRANNQPTPHLVALTSAIRQRQLYMKRRLAVNMIDTAGNHFGTWPVSLQQYPLWIKPQFSPDSAQYALDEELIKTHLKEVGLPGVTPPRNALITEIYQVADEGPLRATIKGRAEDGIGANEEALSKAIIRALQRNLPELTAALEYKPARLLNLTGRELGELVNIGIGRSNFYGSKKNRQHNVQKALNQHIDSVVIPPEGTFSFNQTLGGPVTLSRGWKEAKVIFNGSDLKPAPGGGICQASTTTYRAALSAGLPITERKAHSLYVTYYEKHGVGMDATIFPGFQDLTFVNDTGDYLVIQAFNDGFEAYVNIFGTPDGRQVALEGPYFNSNTGDDFRVEDRPLKKNEIAWRHAVKYPDGEIKENTILSRYQHLPRYIKKQYAESSLHAAASDYKLQITDY